jgi:hypothetical protein
MDRRYATWRNRGKLTDYIDPERSVYYDKIIEAERLGSEI